MNKKYLYIIIGFLHFNGYSQHFQDKYVLPTINVLKLKENSYEKGKISVKWLRQKKELYLKHNFNTITINNSDWKNVEAEFQFSSITSLFKKVLQNVDLKDLHKKWDLDLWYNIEFDATIDVRLVYLKLKKLNLFEIVEPIYKVHLVSADLSNNSFQFLPNDPRFNEQWGFNNTGQGGGKIGKDIQLKDALDIETGNPNVLVAVHDMGIQLNHPDLQQNIAVGKNYNFVDDNDTIVMGYHGTHVAGTIAAVNNNGIGVTGIAGGNGNINSGIRLMSMQIFKGNKSGGLAESFIYAADNGAAISNNSWAYNTENVYNLSVMDAIDYFIENGGGAVQQGGLVVFAAGNKSRPLSYYPSAYERVICVSATNNRDEKASYSTYGNWVDIAAPGGDYSNGVSSQILSTTFYDGYAGDHGTSMSCPHVSGVAALISSKLSGKISASDVREILLTTTDNIDSLNPNFKGLIGTGRLNAFKAVQKAQAINNNTYIQSVDSFKSEFICNSLNLSWKKNANNNDIIIAYSNINDIGILNNGISYNANDLLAGEGKIIYKGNANSFTIPFNNKNQHYFKVWSIGAGNQYSLGKTFELILPTTIYSSGLIEEKFDFPPYFPTQDWRIENIEKDISWIHTVADTSNTGAGDDYSMCMYNYSNNPVLGAVDILKSPFYKTKNTDSLKLNFWYAYKYRNTSHQISDSLEILLSSDCGKTYTSLWKKGGSSLATVSSITDSAFYPFGIDKWKKISLNISSFSNAEKLMFAFKATNGKGNNLFIDNIEVDARYKRDVKLEKISPLKSTCNQTINPEILVRNKGNSSINSFTITYLIDNSNPKSFNWIGNLKKDDSSIIQLSSSTISSGYHILKIFLSNPNNSNDEFTLNDTLTTTFFITPVVSLPIKEGFESTQFPPQNWEIQQSPSDFITWSKNSQFGKGSSSSAFMQNFMYDYKNRVDNLFTPSFSIDRNMDSVIAVFDYAHATKYDSLSNEKFDTLELSYSKDCGKNWNAIWRKGGYELKTVQQNFVYKEFFPNQFSWKTDSVKLINNIKNGDQLQFRFSNISNFGNNTYLDNINIYSKYIAPDVKQKGYAVYPNPFNNKIIVQHLENPKNLNAIKIIDNLGKTIIRIEYSGKALLEETISTQNLNNGVYFIQLIYSDRVVTEKILKQF